MQYPKRYDDGVTEGVPPKPEDRAWAAGFFDGEGHVRAMTQGGKIRSMQLIIGQRDPELLYKFQEIMGGLGTVRQTHSKKNGSTYRYVVCSYSKVRFVLDRMWPWLGKPKKRQAVAAVRCYLGRKQNATVC